jgi:hypothetical protein
LDIAVDLDVRPGDIGGRRFNANINEYAGRGIRYRRARGIGGWKQPFGGGCSKHLNAGQSGVMKWMRLCPDLQPQLNPPKHIVEYASGRQRVNDINANINDIARAAKSVDESTLKSEKRRAHSPSSRSWPVFVPATVLLLREVTCGLARFGLFSLSSAHGIVAPK